MCRENQVRMCAYMLGISRATVNFSGCHGIVDYLSCVDSVGKSRIQACSSSISVTGSKINPACSQAGQKRAHHVELLNKPRKSRASHVEWRSKKGKSTK